MKTIGFPISHKENERRRVLLPDCIAHMPHPESLYFETGYGDVLGISNEEYLKCGVHIVSREEAIRQDIICDPKIGDGEYLTQLKGQTIFGWIHAVQNRDITDKIIAGGLTAYAWEEMFECGRHVFWRNNELAGEAAVLHAYQFMGTLPYETKVAVIGGGNTARGVIKILNMLGAEVFQFDRKMEELLRREIGEFDVIVNCVLWETSRTDHIVNVSDLARMRKNSMIVDVSCDKHGAIESSVPTTIENPVYVVDGVLHYVVDHTPSIFYKTFSRNNSKVVYPYLMRLQTGELDDTLRQACIIRNGQIVDQRIAEFQKR